MTLDPFDRARQKQRVGAYAVVRREGRLLLCRMSASTRSPGRWTLPGGGLQHGEEPHAAALRELQEETGLKGQIERLLGVHTNIYRRSTTGESVHGIRLIYAVTAEGATVGGEASGSTDLARWFDLASAADLELSGHARYALNL